ncbi:hypothetical protein MMC10_009642 [Thelotrema lepadinum]|nr:hypothetical protein [Thelotrema lepadinum]
MPPTLHKCQSCRYVPPNKLLVHALRVLKRDELIRSAMHKKRRAPIVPRLGLSQRTNRRDLRGRRQWKGTSRRQAYRKSHATSCFFRLTTVITCRTIDVRAI